MSRWKDAWDMLIRKLRINRGQAFRTRHVPGFASLTLATYAPVISIPTPQVLVPTTRALVLTKLPPLPSVTSDNPVLVTPTTATLGMSRYAPTVTGVSPITVTVPRRTLATTTYAPSLTVTGQNPVLVTPTKRSLVTARFAPTVTAVAPALITVPRRAVVLTKFTPTVTVPTHWVLVPTKRSLATQRFAPVVSVGTLDQYPPSTTLTKPVPPTPPAIPGYLVPTVMAPWGTTITRVSNVNFQRNIYSRTAGWNSNQTMILLSGYSGAPACVLDGNSYVKLHDLPFLVGMGQWSNTNPNKIYGTWYEENYLRSQTYNGGSSWTLNIEHTFTGYSSISLGDSEGGLSDDDDKCMLLGVTTGGAQHLISFDIGSKTIVSTKVLPRRPDTAFISRSGQYAFIYWYGDGDGTGLTQGLWLYNFANLATPIRQVTPSARHGDPARLADGTEVWAQCAYGGEYFRLDNGANTILFQSLQPYPHNTAFSLGHCSGRATARNGWVYFSNYDYEHTGAGQTLYGRDQIVAANLNNPGEVQVFGYSYHRNEGQSGTNYPTSPFAVPSRDGTKVLFGSEWGDTAPYGAVYAYIAEKT